MLTASHGQLDLLLLVSLHLGCAHVCACVCFRLPLLNNSFIPVEAQALLEKYGRNELVSRRKSRIVVYLSMFTGPMPIMLWLAIVVEFAIQAYVDAGILLFIQFANATLAYYETTKAADAVAALRAALKPQATVKRDGQWQHLDAAEIVPGDLIQLSAGGAVLADCVIQEGGSIEVDRSALTGESMPVAMAANDQPQMGSTVVRGDVEAVVEATGAATFIGRTAVLLQMDTGLGSLQRLLLRIILVLVALSLTLCGIALFYLVFGRNIAFKVALSFAVVLLVASIPVAIEIVSTTTLALGSREMARQGAIVSRLAAIEEMAGVNILCSDKTGTLTQNKMTIQEYCPTYSAYATTMQEVVRYAALASRWQEPPRDALDTMVLGALDVSSELAEYLLIEHIPFDPVRKRTESLVEGPKVPGMNGSTTLERFRVTKGAPQVIDALLDDASVRDRVAIEVQALAARGIRALSVARTATQDSNTWVMLGVLTFLDPPRPDTKATVEAALEKGVDVKMVTGDQVAIAVEMARLLGLGTRIKDAAGLPSLDASGGKIPKDLGAKYGRMILEADGFAQVFPEHKYLIVEALRQQGFAVGMTGDGVNDAPALRRADVGIAVAGATDAARAAADIVLTRPGLSVVVHAIDVARGIFQRVKNFIIYRLAATLQLLLFFFISVFAFPPPDYYCRPDGPNAALVNTQDCPSFFRLPVLLLMLITLLNDGTLISIGYDRVRPSPRPEKWNLRILFLVAAALGLVSMGSSLLLLWAALDSPNSGSLFQGLGLPVPGFGQITSWVQQRRSLTLDGFEFNTSKTHPFHPISFCSVDLSEGVSIGFPDVVFWADEPRAVLEPATQRNSGCCCAVISLRVHGHSMRLACELPR